MPAFEDDDMSAKSGIQPPASAQLSRIINRNTYYDSSLPFAVKHSRCISIATHNISTTFLVSGMIAGSYPLVVRSNTVY